MKKLILPALAILLAATSPGLAQRDDNGRGNGRARGNDNAPQQQAPAPQPQAQPRPDQGRANNPASVDRAARDRAAAQQLEQNRNAYPNRSGRIEQAQPQRNSNPGFNGNNTRPGNNNASNNFNNDNRRFDSNARRDAQRNLRNFGRTWTAPQRFSVGAYRYPQGWNYRRFSFGQFLPSLFFSTSSYYINNWDYYGFDYPPPGTVWVRYGPDALLIDRFTGEILEVSYNVFY